MRDNPEILDNARRPCEACDNLIDNKALSSDCFKGGIERCRWNRAYDEIVKGIPDTESYKEMLHEIRKESNMFIHELYSNEKLPDIRQKLDYKDLLLLVYAIKLLVVRGLRT